jgi:membrane fusion protein (multidrug efflux system)
MSFDEDRARDALQDDSSRAEESVHGVQNQNSRGNKPDAAQGKGGEKSGTDGSGNNDSGKKDSGKDGNGAESDKPRSKMPLIITAIIVVVLGIAAFFIWFAHRNQVSTDDAYTDGNTVTMVPKVSGYVVDLYVSDNTHVKKGDLLLRIDPRDYLTAVAQARAQLALAQAQLSSARDSLKIARVQYPAQLDSARAQLRAAAAQVALAQSSYERQHQVDRRATTQESIDSSTNQRQGAVASLKSAQAQVAIARLVPEQVQSAISAVAEREASLQSAQAQLDQANLNLSFTQVRAPSDGFITLRSIQQGDFATAGQVMFLIVTPEVWITANFKESQLGRMRPGDKVDIKVDAYSGFKLEGHVQSIQYGSGARFSAFPAENATGNFVKIVQRVPVKIVIDRGLDPHRPLPIGLSVSPVVYFP